YASPENVGFSVPVEVCTPGDCPACPNIRDDTARKDRSSVQPHRYGACWVAKQDVRFPVAVIIGDCCNSPRPWRVDNIAVAQGAGSIHQPDGQAPARIAPQDV